MVVPAGGPALTVPAASRDRYAPHAGKPVVLGLRPEDLTNTWTDERREGADVAPLDLVVEIAEPLGSDKLIFSRIGDDRGRRPHQRRSPRPPSARPCACTPT